MKDLYQFLGIDISASEKDIKKVYRSLAMKCHPDRGGNDELFHELNEAYTTLIDPERRAEYDLKLAEHQLAIELPDLDTIDEDLITDDIVDGTELFEDLDEDCANLDVTINVELSLLETFTGKSLRAKYTLPSGKHRVENISLPSGVYAGEVITIENAGDDSYDDLLPGNLNVVINVSEDDNFYRDGNDLVTKIAISPIESMIGLQTTVSHITGDELELNIEPGSVTGDTIVFSGLGFTSVDGELIGDFVCELVITPLAVYDLELAEHLRQLEQQIRNS